MELADLVNTLRSHKELHLKVKVIPKSSRSEIIGLMADGTLKAKVQAPPERGKANAELCVLLAKALNVSPRNVVVVRGENSPLKHIRVSL